MDKEENSNKGMYGIDILVVNNMFVWFWKRLIVGDKVVKV